MEMFAALTGDNYFETFYNEGNKKEKEGGFTMCDIVQGFVRQGREEGRTEMIRKMLETNFATEQQIANLLKISVNEVRKIASKVTVEA